MGALDIHKQDGGHYRVFTPFYRKGCLQATEPRQALLPPTPLETIRDSASLDVDDLNPYQHGINH